MKVGDLVEIEKWCKNKYRKAIVVRIEEWERHGVWIRYLDGGDGTSSNGYAMKQNLKVLSESR
jgi:hypothetical protein|tara:strand:+ start:1980 stop:2168 length:189 start_codon:yes stop_codon:yes gene_type:complete